MLPEMVVKKAQGSRRRAFRFHAAAWGVFEKEILFGYPSMRGKDAR